MDAFEINKIVGALLASVLFMVVLDFVGDALLEPKQPEKVVYFAGAPEEEEPSGQEAAADAETPSEPAPQPAPQPAPESAPEPAPSSLTALIAAASPERGRKVAKKCAACHSFDRGGRNKVGPNLYGVVGAEVAGKDKYAYSKALKSLGGRWGYEELDGFLAKPKAFAAGTKMSFPGLAKIEDRAAVIAFLRSLSESPLPLPSQ